MADRKKHVPKFTFEVRDDDGVLDAMFWADETAKYHYSVLGDVVSFDATFNTNTYNMVFVPFTGIDNHKKCVTFGAGLLSREDTDSYIWLLRSFLKAFGKQPALILSDQDPAMKKAIQEVFPMSHHRLCMWHITSKIPMKISSEVANNSEFRKRFNGLVWNSKIDEFEFEVGWDLMLKEFNLVDNVWLKRMYGLRKSWIPAYFKDVPMSGLMRTTSRSESQNWSFQNTCLTGSYLLNFMSTFESAMERQRHAQSQLDFSTSNSYPIMLTYLPYEPHAAKVYTRRIFYDVQEEIFQSEKSCFQKNVVSDGGVDTICILEKKKSVSTRKQLNKVEDNDVDDCGYDRIFKDSEFKVTHEKEGDAFFCSCKHFEHVGVLCRHIFCVLKFYGYDKIPERYVLRRWCRDVIPSELLRIRLNNLGMDEKVDQIAADIYSTIDECVAGLSHNEEKFDEFLVELRKLQIKFGVDCELHDSISKQSQYENLLGVKVPDVVEIQNPAISRNKGCGSRGKRLKSKKEIMVLKAEKPKRKCRICDQFVHHDKRNCSPKKIAL